MNVFTMQVTLAKSPESSKEWPDSRITDQTCFVSELPCMEALARLMRYQEAYNQRYSLRLTFKLISITMIDDELDGLACLNDEILREFGAEVIEDLPTDPKQFE